MVSSSAAPAAARLGGAFLGMMRRWAVRGMRFGGVMTAGCSVTVAPPIMAMAAEMEPEGPKAEGLRNGGQRVESKSSEQG